MHSRVRIAALLAAVALAGCAGPSPEPEPAPAPVDDELSTLAGWMTGSFSSAAQAAGDERYYDIRLEMVPIWTGRDDGRWLYVEQAAASALDRPYRQRVYHVTAEPDGLYRSEVYELPAPESFAGAFAEPARFDELTPDRLSVREGCAVLLRRASDDAFAGSTVDDDCGSTLRGASFATSEVTVRADGIDSWDRGFDAEGAQVWGAEHGAYLFRKSDG